MAQPPSPLTTVIAARVRARRDELARSAQALADRCKAAGAPQLTRDAIAKLETGRRQHVTVEELVALAYALDTAPAALLVDLDADEAVLTSAVVAKPVEALAWLRGLSALEQQDRRAFADSMAGVWAADPRASFDPMVRATLAELAESLARLNAVYGAMTEV